MTTTRTSWDVSATAATHDLLGGKCTVTNAGANDVYYRENGPTTGLAGTAAQLLDLADGVIRPGASVYFGADVSSLAFACATGLTSTLRAQLGVSALGSNADAKNGWTALYAMANATHTDRAAVTSDDATYPQLSLATCRRSVTFKASFSASAQSATAAVYGSKGGVWNRVATLTFNGGSVSDTAGAGNYDNVNVVGPVRLGDYDAIKVALITAPISGNVAISGTIIS